MNIKYKKFFGFTMTELLISLGIIGVVAAMTVPTLVAKHQRRVLLLGLQKTYSEFTQAIDLFIINEGAKKLNKSYLSLKGASGDDDNITKSAGKFLKKYFRISQDCGLTAQPCFAPTYKSINGTSKDFNCEGYTIATENGAAICLVPAEMGSPDIAAIVYVDVNGKEKPNIGGRDIFSFQIYYDWSVDDGANPSMKKKGASGAQSNRAANFYNSCLSSSYGGGCFGKIINDNWKMDY